MNKQQILDYFEETGQEYAKISCVEKQVESFSVDYPGGRLCVVKFRGDDFHSIKWMCTTCPRIKHTDFYIYSFKHFMATGKILTEGQWQEAIQRAQVAAHEELMERRQQRPGSKLVKKGIRQFINTIDLV